MDELRTKRLLKREQDAPAAIADMLWQYYQAFVDGTHEFEGGLPRVAFIVTFHDDGPEAHFAGAIRREDFRAAMTAIDDADYRTRTDVSRDPDRAKRRKEAEEAERQRIDTHLLQHPFICSHKRCSSRFKTERGRKIHEQTCYFIGTDREAGVE